MAGVLGKPPFILGWDVSGVVEQVGFGVHTLKVGDEVYGMPWFPRQAGGFAEYVTAPSRQFTHKPSTVDHDTAAAVPLAALTAWQILHDAVQVRRGQRVLIHAAAGGVGHFAVQFAKNAGATVIGTARAAKHDWLRELGADEVIDYTAERFEEQANGIDVVVDLVGDHVDNTSTRSLDVLRPGGTLVAVPSGVAPELLDRASARGLTAIPFLVEPDGPALSRIADLIDAGEVRAEVEQVFPFVETAAAHERQESGRTQGKLVVRVAAEAG
ncbi:NADP-dependent oxidoreductase [Actinocrispum sp. NPDC049592]|uniref:NADP-dependent oxidoreductase n=1 Tax=Actinocrispum sp. NPDC049592 TaxID=3154835 RepID=UPI0034201DF3